MASIDSRSTKVDQPDHENSPTRDEAIESSRRTIGDPEKGLPQEADNDPERNEPVQSAPAQTDPSGFPDGGIEAWMAVAGGFCTIFASFGWINCIGVFQAYYETHQLKSYSSSTVAWIPSTESFMLFFWGIIAGRVTDLMGPRWPILFGSFMHIFGLMMTSISTKYYQIFLAQSVCSGIGCSFLFFPTIAAVGSWFRRRRALAFGIMVSGSSLGGIILPIMVQRLVVSIGFGWAIRSTAFLILGLLVFGNLALKSRLPPTKKTVKLSDFIRPFKEVPFSLLVVGSFIIYLGAFLPFNYIIVQAQQQGMSENLASYLVPIVNAASTFGRILPGYLGDKYGVFNVMILFTALSGVISLCIWLPASGNASIIVFALLYGMASGACLSILAALVAQISDIRELGNRVGVLYAVAAVGALIGSPIGGALVARDDGGFSGLKIFTGVTILAGAGFVVLSRQSQIGLAVIKKI